MTTVIILITCWFIFVVPFRTTQYFYVIAACTGAFHKSPTAVHSHFLISFILLYPSNRFLFFPVSRTCLVVTL